MARFTLWMLFVLLELAAIVHGKNLGPPPVKQDPARSTPRKNSRNKEPSVVVSGRVIRNPPKRNAEVAETVTIPESHVFYENYQANFSWSDEKLRAALGIRDETGTTSDHAKRDGEIRKRTPGGTVDNTLIKLPSCLGCIEANQGVVTSLKDLSTEYLERQILIPDSRLQDTCLFYTSVPPFTAEPLEYWDRAALGGADRHTGLSSIATRWACSHNKVTIWNMYSGRNDVSLGPDKPSQRNYWEVYVEGSWLNFLVKNNEQFTYFENMSRSMARHCGGKVYVMTMRPKQLYKYQFIWGKVEYPALYARHTAGLRGAPTHLIAINAADPSEQFELDFATQRPISTLKRTDPDFLHIDEESLLGKRDTCTSTVDYEPPGMDWFG